MLQRLKRNIAAFISRVDMNYATRKVQRYPERHVRIRNDENVITLTRTSDKQQFVIWFHNDDIWLRSKGLKVSAVCTLVDHDGNTIPHMVDIVLDKNFTRAPTDVGAALLWHEYGHILHGHLHDLPNEVSSDPEYVSLDLQKEFEADWFSHTSGQDIRAALVWMRDNVKGVDKITLDKRIAHFDQRVNAS